MDKTAKFTLRAKKLGILIRDARNVSRRSTQDCATAINISENDFTAYEDGQKAPSLPQLETLAYYLGIPVDHFWSNESLTVDSNRIDESVLPRLTELRQRMIGALLRRDRLEANLSLKAVSEKSEIPAQRLKNYELGERAIPLPELEVLLNIIGGRIETFFDKGGPIGQWRTQQIATQQFLELPVELQNFVCKPVNKPYIELAIKLSDMSTEKLRSLAEDLLEITY